MVDKKGKVKSFSIIALGSIIFLLETISLAGTGHRLPPLETDSQKLAFLLEVKDHIPALFSDAARYDIDLFTLLENEKELVEKLKSQPEYERLFTSKQYHDLTITPPQGGISVGAVVIKPESVNEWKESLNKQVELIKKEQLQPPQLIDHVKIFLRKSPTLDDQKFIGKLGVIDKKNSEQSKAQHTLNETCLQLFKTQLERWQCVIDHFDELKILPNLPNKERIGALISSFQAEQMLHSTLSVISILKGTSDGLIPHTWQEVNQRINQLTPDDLIHLSDIDALNPIVYQALEGEHGLQNSIIDKAIQSVQKQGHAYASQTVTNQTKVTTPVKLSQVLPQVGIFRGCTGGDCSSQYSFPYPNDPHERIFFIEEPQTPGSTEKKLKGYVSATEVTLTNGEKGLYVITISGSHVSPGNAELILRGLEKEKEKLDVKHIILPNSTNLGGLINFTPIKGIYESHLKQGTPTTFTYQDQLLRSVIENYKPDSGYNRGQYDHAAKNKDGIILKFKDSNPVTVDLKKQIEPQLNSKDISLYSNEKMIEFILDLNHSGRHNIVNKIKSISEIAHKINLAHIDSLFDTLKSCNSKTVEAYKQAIISSLEEVGITKASGFLEKKSSLLYPGIASCSNAYDSAHIEQLGSFIAKDFKDNFKDTIYQTKIRGDYSKISDKDKNALYKTKGFKNLFKKLIEELKDSDGAIRSSAAKAFGNIKTENKEIHNALAKLLEDSDGAVRSSAASAFGNIKTENKEIHNALAKLLEDSDGAVRFSAASAFLNIKPKDKEIHSALVKLLKDPDGNVRSLAEVALGVIKPEDKEIHIALAHLLKDPDLDARLASARILKNVKSIETHINSCIGSVQSSPINQTKLNEILEILEHSK